MDRRERKRKQVIGSGYGDGVNEIESKRGWGGTYEEVNTGNVLNKISLLLD